MERRARDTRLLRQCFVFGILLCAMLPYGAAQAGLLEDNTNPVVVITGPTGGSLYETTQAAVDLEGTADDDSAIVLIEWETDRGFSGTASGLTYWTGYYWTANGIFLLPGDNVITVRAWDVVGNEGQDQLVVTYTQPGPQPPPSVIKGIDSAKSKVKMDIYKTPAEPSDHVSIVTYLIKGSNEDFVMPMALDVTLTLKVPDPDNPGSMIQIYSETIPADTLGSQYIKYRYTSSGPGIREMTFQNSTSTRVYMYVYVENVDFLPGVREDFETNDPGNFPQNYVDYLVKIKSLNLSVQTGHIAWSGDITIEPLPGDTYGNRVEYLLNR